MLIFSEERLVPTLVNMITLEDEKGGYYYVHRSLYDQAVILTDRYEDNTEALLSGLGFTEDLPENIISFMREVPEPLKILGNFLVLVSKGNLEEFTLADMCGAIHVMSSVLNFRTMFKVPKEMRKSVTFSLSVREEYQIMWHRFFSEAVPFNQVQYSSRGEVSYQNISTEEKSYEDQSTEELLSSLDNFDDFYIDTASAFANAEVAEPEQTKEPEPIDEHATPKESIVATALTKLRGVTK